MPVTFLDEEEEETPAISPAVVSGVTFLDEEEEAPSLGVTFLDEPDPVADYNKAVDRANTLGASYQENFLRYQELMERERTPEETKEAVESWQRAQDAKLSIMDEEERIETLRPKVDKINAERKQARIDQIESLRLDPAFGDEVAERLYQYDQSLQEEIAQAREIPDPAEREEAISAIAKRYGEQETSMLRTALEENFKRFDAAKEAAWLLRQKETGTRGESIKALMSVSNSLNSILGLGLATDILKPITTLSERQRVIDENTSKVDQALEERLKDFTPQQRQNIMEEAEEWRQVWNGEKEVAIIQGRPVFSGDVQDDPERQKEIMDDLLDSGEINSVQHKASLEAIDQTAEQVKNNKLEFFRKLPDYEKRVEGTTEEEAFEKYADERSGFIATVVDHFEAYKQGAAEYIPMTIDGQKLRSIIAEDNEDAASEAAFQLIQGFLDKQVEEIDPFMSKGAQIRGGVLGQVTAQIATQATAQTAIKGLTSLVALLAPHPLVKAAAKAGAPMLGWGVQAGAMANIYGLDWFSTTVNDYLEAANVERIDDLSPEQKSAMYRDSVKAFEAAQKASLFETIEPTVFINMPAFMRKKIVGRIIDGALQIGLETGQEVFAEVYKEAYFRNFVAAHQARSPIDGEEVGYMATGLIPLGGARFVKTSIDVRRENTRDERLKEINKYNAARAEELRAEKALIDAAEQAALNAEGAAPASAEAMKGMVEASKDELDTKIEDVGGEGISIPATVTPQRESETNEQYRDRIEDERAAALVEPAAPATGITPTEPVAPQPAEQPPVAERPVVATETLNPRGKQAVKVLTSIGVDEETAAYVASRYQDEAGEMGAEEWRDFIRNKFEENGGVIPAQMRYSEDPEYYQIAFDVSPEEAATLADNGRYQNEQMAQSELEQNKQWRRKDEQITESEQGVVEAQPEAEGAVVPAGEIPPSPAIEERGVPLPAAAPTEVTPTPETPNLEPLRRVARAEQTEDDVSGLVGQGLVELYNGQPVITQAGLETLPEAERPRLNPEARKIQIDTGANEVVAEAISKNLRIGVDQVGPNVTLPAGWTLDGDIYVPPTPQEVAAQPTQNPVITEYPKGDVDERFEGMTQVEQQGMARSQFSSIEEYRKAFDRWYAANKKRVDVDVAQNYTPDQYEGERLHRFNRAVNEWAARQEVAPAPEVRESRREPAPLTQQDREYLDAVERGDLDAASRAIDALVSGAGATPVKGTRVYRGSIEATGEVGGAGVGSTLGSGVYVTSNREEEGKLAALDYAGGKFTKGSDGKIQEFVIDLDNAFVLDTDKRYDLDDLIEDTRLKPWFRNRLTSWRDNGWYKDGLTGGNIVSLIQGPPKGHGKKADIGTAGFDAVVTFEDGQVYEAAVTNPAIINQIEAVETRGGVPQRGVQEKLVRLPSGEIKSADAVTRDNQGNVIPPSQRFQPTEEDIRYARREPSVEARQQYAPKTEEEQKAFDKASSNKVLARSPQLAVAAVRMKNGEITSGEYADLVDAIDPFTAKGADPIPTKEKIQQYISSDKAGQVMQPIESGKEVEFRIDIPTYNRSTAAGDTVYAVTAHEPVAADAKGVGKVISFVGVAKVNNPTFMTRAISGRGTAADIAAGAGKFPLATVKGNYEPITDLPADINDPNVWTEVGYNPIRSSFFVDTRSKDAVVGGSEAIMVGSRVFVKDAVLEPRPTGVTMGERYAQIQMPRPAGMETEAVATKVESLGFGRGGILSVVNEPNASFEGRTIIRDGKVVGIELNAAALKDDAAVERVLNHEIAESANADGALNRLVAGLTPKERKEINDAITRLGYAERARTAEEAARAVELLAEGWRGRKWFERAVARIEAWANKLGYKLTRRAAEYIAARNVSEVNTEFKEAYNKFITPSSQEGAVIRESRREDLGAAIPDPDANEEGSNAETEAAVTQRAEAKKAQELVTGHSILADEVPAELREEAQANYQNGMTLGDFLNPELFNLGEAYNPYIAATWLELNGGLMPTVKVEGKEIAKPEKGTSKSEALRLLKRASDILDSRSETTGGKELTYSLQDIMATWMESGLGPAALKNAIVQFTNLDVAQADKTANDFANVYQLAQNVTATKERARVRMDRALPAVTARQQREKERMIKLEEAAGSIDSIAEAIRIAYDIGIKKPKTDKATEKKQIEEQLRQAKQILRDVVPKQYLGDQLLTLERATGLEGLKKVVEAAQNGLNQARLDEAVAGAKKAFDRAQKAVKANEIGPEAMAVLWDFVETYSKKGIGPETRAKIEDAISRYQADPVGALQDLATEKYLKQKGALGTIKIDKSLGLDSLKEISRIINTTLHADKVARGEMLFNKQQTRQEMVDEYSEEIDGIKSMAKARKDGSMTIGLFNRVALYNGLRPESLLRALGLNKLNEFVYKRLALDAYGDELNSRHQLKHKIEDRIKEITGLEVGTKDFDLWSKEVIELTGVDTSGRTKPIKIYRKEFLDILASLRDPSNLKRAVNSGGYVIERLDLSNLDTVKITPETYIEIMGRATDQDNQMVDMMMDLYNNDLFQILENASVQAYGHGIKAVSGYYPRTADKWTRATEVKKDLDYISYYQQAVDSVGFMKERDERSRSKLRSVDFLQRLDYHVTNTARIGAYLPIVRDIDMVLGDPKIARPLASKIGEEGLNMIREMVRQQTTPTVGLSQGVISTLVGNMGIGVLGFKLHAAMQNPVGIPIALGYYGLDGLRYAQKGLLSGVKRGLNKPDRKKAHDILTQYSPYYNERYGLGGFMQEFTSGMSNAPSNVKWRKNLETAAMSWLEGTDRFGAFVRFRLAQEVIKDTTNLQEGTEDFNRAVAKEWQLMMFRSENTAHGADRTGVFQFAAKNPAFKLFIMFQSAVSKIYSLFAEAMIQSQQGGAQNMREASVKLMFVGASLGMSTAISNAFYSMLYPRDEEDEEKKALSVAASYLSAPLSVIPVVGNTLNTYMRQWITGEKRRKPMQIDAFSGFVFGSLDAMDTAYRGIGQLYNDEIDEQTGNPKYWSTSYKAMKDGLSMSGIIFGKPFAGVMQNIQLANQLSKRIQEISAGEPTTEDFQKKIKEYEKEQRGEPTTQEYAKIFYAVADDDQRKFNRALKDLQAKRPDIKRQDLINAIRRRPEFRVVGMVRSGKIKQKDLEANGITRDYYQTQRATLRAMEEAAKTMYRDSKD